MVVGEDTVFQYH